MRKIITAVALALAVAVALPACAILDKASAPVSQMTREQAVNAVVAIKASYGVLVRGATAYIRQTPCSLPNAPPAPLCSSTPVVLEMVKLQESAAVGIAEAEGVTRRLDADSTVLQAAVDSARAGYSAFNVIVSTYRK